MTLKKWLVLNKIVATRRGHNRLIETNVTDLWGLDDYVVTTSASGQVWMSRRRPFSDDERRIRSNIRNACVGLSPEELDKLMASFSDEFSQDCVHEWILEVSRD